MKAIFPCKGVVVITKHNVDVINNFYKENLINSKLFVEYNENDFAVQVGNFNYLPKKAKIILEPNTHLLTIKELHDVLSQTANKNTSEKTSIDTTKPIEDNFIIDHPFFQTLKPLN